MRFDITPGRPIGSYLNKSLMDGFISWIEPPSIGFPNCDGSHHIIAAVIVDLKRDLATVRRLDRQHTSLGIRIIII